MRKEGYSRCLDIINNVIEKINNKENIKDIKKYLENENDNLNPILRKIFGDGYTFYGIKEKNELELLNINHYDDYLKLLDSL